MDATKIRPIGSPTTPIIYAYTEPGVTYREGWIKIGQTKNDAEKRIAEQTHTAGIRTRLEWQDFAIFKDGSNQTFTDKQFHHWLVNKKGVKQLYEDGSPRELFQLDAATSKDYFNQYANREIPINASQSTFTLRQEQQDAIDKTRAWFESEEEEQEFLWNAKPRFGKTLTAYALCQAMDFKKILVVSNRPSISNSWAEDYFKFIGWRKEYSFVSDNEALKGRPGVLTRREFVDNKTAPKKMIAFESLQGLKGSIYFGGDYDKLKWINDLEFDLLIVDESHEGVETLKTERAFENIKAKHTLYLSGTPFRQLASAQFGEDQIFNWSYADEQEAKANWQGNGVNPYERLPKLCLFTYQMSEIIRDKAKKGVILTEGDEAVDYAFDLNEFFLTNERGKFVHEDDVKKFLDALTRQEKYPFSTPESRSALSHTMWYLNRVASAKALKKLLEEHEVFSEYKIVLAVGDEREEDAPRLKAFDQVKKAIAENEKTITLTVGQLTVGVTIPEWSAVMMLCNMSSPASYMQAAFRAQNPNYELVGEQLMMKENAYVFDFDPARTLVIFDEFATNLSPDTASGGGTGEERDRKLLRLLNFLPVIGEDEQGKMVELDAAQVLSIPRRLKSREVVKHGFMSNFLFQNISDIFSAPDIVRKIMANLPTASEEKRKPKPETLAKMGELPTDAKGNIEIPGQIAIGQAQEMFGEKIYELIDSLTEEIAASLDSVEPNALSSVANETGKKLKERLVKKVIEPIAQKEELKKSSQRAIEKKAEAEIDRKIDKIAAEYEQKAKIAEAEYKEEVKTAPSEEKKREAEKKLNASLESAASELKSRLEETVKQTLEKKPAEIFKQADTAKAEDKKRNIESEIRARLRGFSRTIPSFIMAYGDDKLKLDNFDQYVNRDIFKDVTGISIEQFLFLRDGGDYTDEETGKKERFAGHLFDETVFNDSVREFLKKKEELANYFDENLEEDIFDYIPPQKTNQIFTPRGIVIMMVDLLERENPGCFDNPNLTFADLYMKSGMYITEIIKRLYRSNGLKKAFPDGEERIRHILEKQVYGIAPNDIIFRIAKNYILGFDPHLDISGHNFVEADTVAAAKSNSLKDVVDSNFMFQSRL